jgi:hypothetical protein
VNPKINAIMAKIAFQDIIRGKRIMLSIILIGRNGSIKNNRVKFHGTFRGKRISSSIILKSRKRTPKVVFIASLIESLKF